MKLNNLKYPVFLIDNHFDCISKHENDSYGNRFKVMNKSNIRKKTIVSSFIMDSTNTIFKVIDIEVLGEYDKQTIWSRFFGSKLMKVELLVEIVKDDNIFNKCIEMLPYVSNISAYCRSHEKD